jgi:hypothetical protein
MGQSGRREPVALHDDEIERRMNAGIRRALSTPPSPTKELVGKTERAKIQRESRAIRARRSKPKGGAAS